MLKNVIPKYVLGFRVSEVITKMYNSGYKKLLDITASLKSIPLPGLKPYDPQCMLTRFHVPCSLPLDSTLLEK